MPKVKHAFIQSGIRFDLGFVPIHHFDLEELLDRRTLAEFLKS